jgi:D-alanyl-D-alanine carboxypeptidase/D-alanyl-D-alanine-endopeptidase (penicillin-binding protein 4)
VTRHAVFTASVIIAGAGLLAPACSHRAPGVPSSAPSTQAPAPSTQHQAPSTSQGRGLEARAALIRDLDQIFDDPALLRAVIAVRVDTLDRTPLTLYGRNTAKLVMPASNMKLLTLATAAERLGWDFRYTTRLEIAGTIDGGVLRGDVIVIGSGDPTMEAANGQPAPVLGEFVDALRKAGIQRLDGRVIGDDNAFDEEGLGPGWAWDYLSAGYAAPSGALSYNLNQIAVRIAPGSAAGEPAIIDASPAGHGLTLVSSITTGDNASSTSTSIDVYRLPGSPRLALSGTIRAGAAPVTRLVSIDNPTRFFADALRLSLESSGISVRDGAWDLDDLGERPPAANRRSLAAHQSVPLSEIAALLMKVSLNFDTENLLKTVGLVVRQQGTLDAGRTVARETLAPWGIPPDAYVMYDGSGLSRYNYVSADAIVTLLTHVWQTDRLRGPFIASLPIAGKDGTLASRMRGTALEGKVEAKTGTISNVRSLSGFLETKSGDHIVFSMIANNFTTSSGQIDAIVERALARLAEW